MSRKNRIQKAFPEYATSLRGNSILSLTPASAPLLAFPRTNQSEIPALLTRAKPRVGPAMPVNLIKKLPATLTQVTALSSLRVKVKSRSRERIDR